jgi:hypothetical protein
VSVPGAIDVIGATEAIADLAKALRRLSWLLIQSHLTLRTAGNQDKEDRLRGHGRPISTYVAALETCTDDAAKDAADEFGQAPGAA